MPRIFSPTLDLPREHRLLFFAGPELPPPHQDRADRPETPEHLQYDRSRDSEGDPEAQRERLNRSRDRVAREQKSDEQDQTAIRRLENQIGPFPTRREALARENYSAFLLADQLRVTLGARGVDSKEAHRIVLEMRELLARVRQLDQDRALDVFENANDALRTVGYVLHTNPQLTTLDAVQTPLQPNHAAEARSVRNELLAHQEYAIFRLAGRLTLALNEQGVASPSVQTIAANLHSLLRSIQEIDPARATTLFHEVNDDLQSTGFALMTDPRLESLRLAAIPHSPETLPTEPSKPN